MSSTAVTSPAPPHRENGQKIRRARKLLGLNQTNFGQRVGCSFRTVVRLEKGENLPRRGLRDRIVDVSGTDEKIEAAWDDEDEDMSVDGYVLTLTGRTTQDAGHEVAEYLLRGIQRDRQRLRQIEKALG